MSTGPAVAPVAGLPGVLLVETLRFSYERGWFTESFNAADFAAAGIDRVFIQDNHSFNAESGTLRGLHFQRPPAAQAKLVRVLRGAIFEVAVDIRADSTSFGRYAAVRLDATEGRQLYIPEGFAHGYCTLEAETEVFYKVTAPYSPADEDGLAWDDPTLGIKWPVAAADATMVARDRSWPRLADLRPWPGA